MAKKAKAVRYPEFFYLPMKVMPWSSASVGGTPVAGPADTFGFMVAFNTREAAEREYPGDEIREFGRVEIRSAPKRRRAGRRKP